MTDEPEEFRSSCEEVMGKQEKSDAIEDVP